MADIFAELEGYGLSEFSEVDLFGNKREEVDLTNITGANKKKVDSENDYIFEKTYTCVVCNKEFKEKVVKAGRLRVVGHEEDLRPIYDGYDLAKYDVVMCPHCGYSALSKNFSALSDTMIKMIREEIGSKFKPRDAYDELYTYDDAIERFKMALVNCIVKHSKVSEQAYICLKLAWLYRGKAEMLPDCTDDYEKKFNDCKVNEEAFLKRAYEGFTNSLSKENFPICGMDEYTLSYIMAVLARKNGDYSNSMKLLGRVILSNGAKNSLKEMAREQKEILETHIRENSQ